MRFEKVLGKLDKCLTKEARAVGYSHRLNVVRSQDGYYLYSICIRKVDGFSYVEDVVGCLTSSGHDGEIKGIYLEHTRFDNLYKKDIDSINKVLSRKVK